MKKIIYTENEELEELNFKNIANLCPEDIDSFIKQNLNSFELLSNLYKDYNKPLKQISKTRNSIMELKYGKDKLLLSIFRDHLKPPYFLNYKKINLKAFISFCLIELNDYSTKITFNKLEESGKITDINKLLKYFDNNKKLIISLKLKELYHLIGIRKNSKTEGKDLLLDFIYEDITIDNFDQKLIMENELYKSSHISKFASFPWIKETLEKPDYIFGKDADISEKINPDLIFVRITGDGTKSAPFMHHYVGLVEKGKYRYTIKSQFPVRENTNNNKSSIEQKINKNLVLYIRNGVEEPF